MTCLQLTLNSPALPPKVMMREDIRLVTLVTCWNWMMGSKGFCFTILSTAAYVLNFPLIEIKRKRETCGLGPRTNTMAWMLRLASLSISVSESKDLPWSRNLRKVDVASCSWSAFQTGTTISSLCERETGNAHRGSQAASVTISLSRTSRDGTHVSQGRQNWGQKPRAGIRRAPRVQLCPVVSYRI